MSTRRRNPASFASKGIRFYDTEPSLSITQTTIQESMTTEQKEYVVSTKTISNNGITTVVAGDTVTFNGVSFKTPPTGFPNPPGKETFQVFINGMVVESSAVISVTDTGSGVAVKFDLDELNFTLDSNDEVTITGKFN